MAGDIRDNAARGGVSGDIQEQQQQQQQQEEQQDETMLGSISCDNQVMDMTDWDFSETQTMQASMHVVKKQEGEGNHTFNSHTGH